MEDFPMKKLINKINGFGTAVICRAHTNPDTL